MRVIAGEFRGRPLVAPFGLRTRPTSDRVRTALFDLLGSVPAGRRVADLFAGTGSLGIEALSRGAAFALFVENDRAALDSLQENLTRLGLEDRSKVLRQDATRCNWQDAAPFGLVFLDPPYQFTAPEEVLLEAARGVGPGGVVAFEEDAKSHETKAPDGFAVWKSRRYGSTRITLYVRETS